jgi:hypothetical protein
MLTRAFFDYLGVREGFGWELLNIVSFIATAERLISVAAWGIVILIVTRPLAKEKLISAKNLIR